MVTPFIPKHFSPGCFVINIPKGAEDLIKSILLKGRFSKVVSRYLPVDSTSAATPCSATQSQELAEGWISSAGV